MTMCRFEISLMPLLALKQSKKSDYSYTTYTLKMPHTNFLKHSLDEVPNVGLSCARCIRGSSGFRNLLLEDMYCVSKNVFNIYEYNCQKCVTAK
jgi:hypothetical protein